MFPKSIALEAYNRSGRRCECKCSYHNHGQKCQNILIWNRRGFNGSGGWEVHPIDNNGLVSLDNCEILCKSCFRLVKKIKNKDLANPGLCSMRPALKNSISTTTTTGL
ncbi:hypothetical protein Pmgp_00362 [Pelotomaculum propionicicum]|uniref:HNH domain-containing protein n=1 Tax=Pelotomaculum propionicicum TaxID=258475 RepID=A0A4Y7RWT4_9FIRM|nr:hypothetical protein Pmgp_00362 [Pelotomaculum propionicicum]